ncbi:MAG: InlB B-repeat-containing protein [Clostridia bacterium]|nr:InlB B-repeat-containing protein [Clostridia bacterium]
MKKSTRILAIILASVLLFSAVPFAASAAEGFEISEFDYGYWGPSDTPLLVILVNIDPDPYKDGETNETLLRHQDHSYWYEMFFGDGPKTMKSYFEIQSGGNFRFTPAPENYANAAKKDVANDGIIEVTVNTSIAKGTKGSTSDPERYAALAAAVNAGYVNFASYDKNKDGRVSEDELMVAFIVAGYEYTRNGTQTPSYNAHKNSFIYDFNGVTVSTDYVKCGEMIDNDTPLTVGSFCHELGHALGNGDLYAAGGGNWGGANSPAGKVSVMAGNGSAGANTGEKKGESPSNFDPYHLTVYGLYDYTNVGDGTYTLYSRQSKEGKYNILKVTSPNPNEYYLIENRYFDNSTEHFDSDTNYDGTRGIIIWHVDQGIADAGRAGAGMRINSPGTNADIGVAALAPVPTPVDEGGTPRHTASSGVFNKAGLVFNCHDYFFPGSETWYTSLTEAEAANLNLKIEILDDPGHEIRIKVTGAVEASPRYTFATKLEDNNLVASGKITDLNAQVLTSLTLEIAKKEDFSDAVSVSLTPNTDGTYSHTFANLERGHDYYTRVVLGTKNGDFSKTTKDRLMELVVEDTTKYQIRFFRGISAKDKAYTVDAKVGEPIVLTFPMTKSGYVFAGWYTDEAYTERFDVSRGKNDNQDITLYARWVEKTAAAKLTVNGATLVNAKVDETGYGVIGETFREPTVVLNEGESVLWFADAAYTTPFDFTKTIESADAVTAYAVILKEGQTLEDYLNASKPQTPPTEDPETPEDPTETHEDCEAGFFAKIWNAIVNFFRRLFGKPEICVCGKEI